MFRQDRTNPSTYVSTWNGRRDLAKANPSTAVSAWMNGGLAGGAAIPIAYGGMMTQYEDSGTTYRVHAFRGTGTLTVVGNGDVEYLIVAGGGYGKMGGGGAGGMLTGEATLDVASSPYTITVGAGGRNDGSTSGTNGNDSVALGVTATGGGRSGYWGTEAGQAGGSGGGAAGSYSATTYAGGAGTAGQGNNGGGGGYYFSGGGGGKGAVGATGVAGSGSAVAVGGNGGDGATGLGVNTPTPVYAAGGGGSATSAGGGVTLGTGGSSSLGGNAGSAAANNIGNGGIVNTGSGSGGDWSYHNDDGGAGIVLIRYAVA